MKKKITFLHLQIIESDESSTSSDTVQKNNLSQQEHSLSLIQKNLEALLKTVGLDSNMTSYDTMAAQIAAFKRMQNNELNQVNPFYSSECYYYSSFSVYKINCLFIYLTIIFFALRFILSISSSITDNDSGTYGKSLS
jgi:hypothetical protein